MSALPHPVADDVDGPRVDDGLLVELLLLVEGKDGPAQSIERAEIRHRDDATVNAHLDRLAALGLVMADRVAGHRRRVCRLTDDGRAWLREHRGALRLGDF